MIVSTLQKVDKSLFSRTMGIHVAVREQKGPARAGVDGCPTMRHPVHKAQERAGWKRRIDCSERLASLINLAP